MPSEQEQIFHATAISLSSNGCLILGPSGSGKSSLALQCLALGADLIADDRVLARVREGTVMLSAPPTLPAAIEARGVGLLAAPLADPARLDLVVDMSVAETARHPVPNQTDILGVPVRCLHNVEMAHFPFALIHYLRHGVAQL